MNVEHVKGQPAALTYVREKVVYQKDINRESPSGCPFKLNLPLLKYFEYLAYALRLRWRVRHTMKK